MRTGNVFFKYVGVVVAVVFFWTNCVWAGVVAAPDKLAAQSRVGDVFSKARVVYTGTALHSTLVYENVGELKVLFQNQERIKEKLREKIGDGADKLKTLIFSDSADSKKIAYYTFNLEEGYFYRFTNAREVDDPLRRLIEAEGAKVDVPINGDNYYQEIIRITPQISGLVHEVLRQAYEKEGTDGKDTSELLKVEQIMDRLDSADMLGQMAAVYGVEDHPREEHEGVRQEHPDNKFVDCGFESDKGTYKNRMGWTIENLKWLLANPDKVEAVLKDAEDIRKEYKYVIFCGMGGSGLSVQTVKTTFGKEGGIKIFSLRSTDPAVIADILDEITKDAGSLEAALKATLVIPISKSGKTEETVKHKQYFEGLFGKFSIDAEEHIWVITDKGSPMDTKKYEQREIQLNGKGDIGGRFTSPTTNIFLLPLALVAPEKVWEVLKKAKEMNETKDASEDIFVRLGTFLYYMAKETGRDKVTMFVPDELKEVPLWAEQLFEESLGKDGKGVTLFYGETLGADMLKTSENSDRVFVRINVGGEKTKDGLWKYLKENKYPVFEINIGDINEIGGLMLGLQKTVATIGYLWDICFVDQPAVEGYKNGTREVMSALKPGEKVTVPQDWVCAKSNSLKLYYQPLLDIGAVTMDELKTEVEQVFDSSINDAAAVYAAIINILRRKPGFEAAELTSYGRMTKGLRGIMEEVRYDIFNRWLKLPTKLGEGPDKNHSYQQNIEGGKNMFFSTYILPLVLQQPDALAFDDNLIKAQAIGTVTSMVKNKRKAVLITADGDMGSAEGDVKTFFRMVKHYLQINTQRQISSENYDEWIGKTVTMTDLNDDMFRDYDFRSVGRRFKPEIMFRFGLVWARMAIEKAEKAGIDDNRTVLVAKDARYVEPEMMNALVAAFRYCGLNVVYMAYDTPNAVTSYSWGVQQVSPLMSIFVTASHLSKSAEVVVRGFKIAMLKEKGGNIQSMNKDEIQQDSLKAMRQIIQNPESIKGMEAEIKGSFSPLNVNENTVRINSLVGQIAAKGDSLYEFGTALKSAGNPVGVLDEYEKKYEGSELPLRGMKIVVEGSNTPSGGLAAEAFRRLGANVIAINREIKEVSGVHKADPSVKENLKELKETIKKEGADFGMAFDLDGDRGAIVVPDIKSEDGFTTLAPDNLLAILLPVLVKDWGYSKEKTGKDAGVIRDVLGTFAVNDTAGLLGIETFQTDAGYVFLKKRKEEEEEKKGMVFPIYGERSGHIWLHATGEIENPIAVGVLLAVLVRKEKADYFDRRINGQLRGSDSKTPVIDVYKEKTIQYSQSERFQPLFHPSLLKQLSSDSRNDTGWKYDENKPKDPPQKLIALGRDYGIRKLEEEFAKGKVFQTRAGRFVVKDIYAYPDPRDKLYRYIDIPFDLDGKFAGRFVFRASSNDPSFVCTYEAKAWDGLSVDEVSLRRVSIAGIVLGFLIRNEMAVVGKGEIKRLFPYLSDERIEDMYGKSNLLDVEADYKTSQRAVQDSQPVQEAAEVFEELADPQEEEYYIVDYTGRIVERLSVSGVRVLRVKGWSRKDVQDGLRNLVLVRKTREEMLAGLDRSICGIGITGGGDCAGIADFLSSLRMNLSPSLVMLGVKSAGKGLMVSPEKFPEQLILVDELAALDFIGQASTPLGSSREDPLKNDPENTAKNITGYKFFFATGGDDHLGLLERMTKIFPDMILVGTFKSIDGDGCINNKPAQMLGFSTAAQDYRNAIWSAAQNARTHGEAHVIEVFGRKAGKLAFEASRRYPPDFMELSREERRKMIECGDRMIILVPEKPVTLRAIAKKAKDTKAQKGSCVVVVAEGFMPPELKLEMDRLAKDTELKEKWLKRKLPVEEIPGLINISGEGENDPRNDIITILQDRELAAQFAKTVWETGFDDHGNVTKLAGIRKFIIQVLIRLGGIKKVNEILENYEARGASPNKYDTVMGEKVGRKMAELVNAGVTGGKAVVYFERMNALTEDPVVVDLKDVSNQNTLRNKDLYSDELLRENGVFWEEEISQGSHLVRTASEEAEKPLYTIGIDENGVLKLQETGEEPDRYAGMIKDAVARLGHIYGLGIFTKIAQIQIVENLNGGKLYPQGRAPLASYREGVLKIDRLLFSYGPYILFEELEHEFLEGIGSVIPGNNEIFSDIAATYRNVMRFLEPNDGVTNGEFKWGRDEYQDGIISALNKPVDPDGEYLALLTKIKDLQDSGISRNDILALVVVYVMRTKLYETVRDKLGLPDALAVRIKQLDPKLQDVLQVFNEIDEAKDAADEVQRTEWETITVVRTFTGLRVQGLEKIKQALAGMIGALAKQVSNADKLAGKLTRSETKKYILVSEERLKELKTAMGEDEFKQVEARLAENNYFICTNLPEGANLADAIRLVDPGDLENTHQVAGMLYLPMLYTRSALYMSALVLQAGGDLNSVPLVKAFLGDLYTELTDDELMLLVTQPWQILPKIQSVIQDIENLRGAVALIEKAA